MIYNTTFPRWLQFLASLGSQIEGFVGKAVGPRGSWACSFSTFPFVSGRVVFDFFAVAPGLEATGSDPPPDLDNLSYGKLYELATGVICLSRAFMSSV